MDTYYKITDEFPSTTGVYGIRFLNSENDKVYIGSASKAGSKRIYENGFHHRWDRHLSKLRLQKHHSPKLQNAYNKYGEENLVFFIIEECFPEVCVGREQFYIDEFKSFDYGYNCRPNAVSFLGFKHSEKSKLKMSLSKKTERDKIASQIIEMYKSGLTYRQIDLEIGIGRRRIKNILQENGFTDIRNRSDYVKIRVYQYDKNGNFIKIYESACHAEVESDGLFKESGVRRTARGEQITTHGYYFSYENISKEECYETIKRLKEIQSNHLSQIKKNSITPEERQRLSEINKNNNNRCKYRNVKQLDMDGNLIKIWEHIQAIKEEMGFKNTLAVARVLRKERKSYKNFRWEI